MSFTTAEITMPCPTIVRRIAAVCHEWPCDVQRGAAEHQRTVRAVKSAVAPPAAAPSLQRGRTGTGGAP